jgi:hypothetical protein
MGGLVLADVFQETMLNVLIVVRCIYSNLQAVINWPASCAVA